MFPIKIESFRKNGSERKGYVVLRPTSPHTGQLPRENESADGNNHHISTLFDAEKGKEFDICKYRRMLLISLE